MVDVLMTKNPVGPKARKPQQRPQKLQEIKFSEDQQCYPHRTFVYIPVQ